MADPIDTALQSVNTKPSLPADPLDTAMKSANPAQKLASDKLASTSDAANAAKEKALSKLPKTKDPELLKKEKEAEARQKAAQVKEGVLKKKSQTLDIAKNLALGLAMSKLGKIQGAASSVIGSANSALGTAGAAVATGTAILGLLRKKKPAAKQTQDIIKADQKTKEVEKERVQTSQENHKKNVEAFTYPLKPVEVTPQPPKPPEIPIQPPTSPQPTPTPSPSSRPLEDFYIVGGIELGTYTGWTAYYRNESIVSSNLYKDTEPSAQKVAEVEKSLSYAVCEKALLLLRSGLSLPWLNNRILDGCPNTLNGGSGGFSIGVSNVKINES